MGPGFALVTKAEHKIRMLGSNLYAPGRGCEAVLPSVIQSTHLIASKYIF